MKKTFAFLTVVLILILSENITIANTISHHGYYPFHRQRYIEHYKGANVTFSNARKGTLSYFSAVLGKTLSEDNTTDIKYDRYSRVTHMKTFDKIEYNIKYNQDGGFEMSINDPNESMINIIKYNRRNLKISDTTVEKTENKKAKK